MCGFRMNMAERECEFLNPEIENTSINCQKEGTSTMAILLHIAVEDIVVKEYIVGQTIARS